MADDEYEIIPTSPLRRLEKRMEQVEGGSYSSEIRKLIEQVIELIKSNQRIIDDSIKANNDLIGEVSKVPKRIEDLIIEMREFMKLLRTSAEEEEVSSVSKEVMEPLVDKMAELIDQNKKNNDVNQAVLTTLGIIEKRLKRAYMQSPGYAQAQTESMEYSGR
jgi:hydrogenase maturation factor HypF (carbamoyltransferase family)